MKLNFLYYPIMIAAALAGASCSSDEPEIGGQPTDPDVLPKFKTLKVTVIDYSPAPGQFVNVIPEWEEGDDAAAMCRKATEYLNDGDMITLGGFGGSVTVRLDEPVERVKGRCELQILGNAISGSSEPGNVYVSPDNEKWYLLKGDSGYDPAKVATVTYSRPAADATDKTYIAWTLTHAGSDTPVTGYLYRVPLYHSQCYFPLWNDAETITLSTLHLPDNGTINPDNGQYVLLPVGGYADSYPNDSELSFLDLDNAVDEAGIHVSDLDAIRYVRIATGVLQNNGPLGECSTEVSGIVKIMK